jgi:cytochrome c553
MRVRNEGRAFQYKVKTPASPIKTCRYSYGFNSTPLSCLPLPLRQNSPMFRQIALALTALCLTSLNALAAPFEDTLAQRSQACTLCHGAQGKAGPDGYYPRLAGKPAAYLYHQLLNFQQDRRHYGPMTQLIAPLNGPYLKEIAQYFSQLELPYPPPLPSNAAPETLALGQRLVQFGDAARGIAACASCHGTAMTGVLPATPGLVGLPRDYLNAQLGAWKSGKRQAHAPDCMKAVVARLSEADINAAASWLAAQPVPANAKAVAQRPTLSTAGPATQCGSAP